MSILRKKGYALQLDIWGHLESQDTKSQESINELKGESEKLKENNIKLC
ncbi:MAG: hypothetical protein U9Q15_04790 [Patescibacteria group bacterium]|nr:hypothetical protein [Patescibacteria group bacterium]